MDLSRLIPKGWEQSERWGARWTGENLWDERIKKLICVMYLPVLRRTISALLYFTL
jgi:hypothetical protein